MAATDSGFYPITDFLSYNVMSCYIDVVSIIYEYSNNTFRILNTTTADLDMVRRVVVFADTAFISNRLPVIIEGTSDYATTFGYELSREVMGMSAYIYEPGESLALRMAEVKIGTKLQLMPFVLFVTVLIIYGYVLSFHLT